MPLKEMGYEPIVFSIKTGKEVKSILDATKIKTYSDIYWMVRDEIVADLNKRGIIDSYKKEEYELFMQCFYDMFFKNEGIGSWWYMDENENPYIAISYNMDYWIKVTLPGKYTK